MSYAVRKDGQGWRAVSGPEDCSNDELWQEDQPAPVTDEWGEYRAEAQIALDKSDVTIMRCVENGITVPSAWADYRKALRAIISAKNGDSTQPLPTRPAYPAGT